MHNGLLILTTALCLALAACKQAPDSSIDARAPAPAASAPATETTAPDAATTTAADTAPTLPQRYVCDGLTITAKYSEGAAIVSLDNRVLTLPHVASASGAKYADKDGNTLWTKGGGDGTLTLAGEGRDRNCTATSTAGMH